MKKKKNKEYEPIIGFKLSDAVSRIVVGKDAKREIPAMFIKECKQAEVVQQNWDKK